MFCKECGGEMPDDSKFCPKCGIAIFSDHENNVTDQGVAKEKMKSGKPTVGGSFCYAILFEVILNIIMMIIGEDTSLDLSLGTVIILWIIELVIVTAIVHGFRRWKWDSKH